jgi:hypothetical protein
MPQHFVPREEPLYPLNRCLSETQSQSRQFWIREYYLPLPGFEPQTLQPLASRYTNYAEPARET